MHGLVNINCIKHSSKYTYLLVTNHHSMLCKVPDECRCYGLLYNVNLPQSHEFLSPTVTWILVVLYQPWTSNHPSPVLYWRGACIQHDYSPPWTGIRHIHQVSLIVLHICRLAFCSVLCVQTDRCGQIQAVCRPHHTEPKFPSAAFQSQLCIPLKINTMTKSDHQNYMEF